MARRYLSILAPRQPCQPVIRFGFSQVQAVALPGRLGTLRVFIKRLPLFLLLDVIHDGVLQQAMQRALLRICQPLGALLQFFIQLYDCIQ